MRSIFLITLLFPMLCRADALPLGGSANVALSDKVAGDKSGGWTDQGAENSLGGFPSGRVLFSDIPFEIPPEGEPAAIAFRSIRRPDLPARAAIPARGAKGNFLYILSACAFEFSRGQDAAIITVNYADGSAQSEPVAYEDRTGAWWTPSTPDNGLVAWRGKNGLGVPVGVYLAWIPLKEEAAVESVDVRAADTRGMFLLLGLSINDTPPPPIPPRWIPEPLDTSSWIPQHPLADNSRPSVWPRLESDRQLALEIGLPCRDLDEKTASALARMARLLGYNAVRLPSLEKLLPPTDTAVTTGVDPAAKNSLAALLRALQAENLAPGLTLGGGRNYGIDDGVAAYRQIDSRLANQLLVDAEASRLFLDAARQFPPEKISTVSLLTSAILLGDYESLFTAPHRRMLLNAWRAWLLERYRGDPALLAAWQVPGDAPPLNPNESLAESGIALLNPHNFSMFQSRYRRRAADQMRFLEDLQSKWFARVLPEVGNIFPGAVILSPGWMVADRIGDFHIRAALALDGIEEVLPGTSAGTGTEGAVYFLNVSPFLPPARWSFRQAFNRIAGRPFHIDENAAAWPDDHEFARILLTMAMGSLQGWNGLLHRSLTGLEQPPQMEQTRDGANVLQNPALLAVLPLGRHLFLRKDLQTAETIFSRRLQSPDDFAESGPQSLPPTLQNLLFVGGVEASTSDSPIPPRSEAASGILKSVTGQIECDQENDTLRILSPASLALAGTLGGTVSSGALELATAGGFGVVYASSLDGSSLASSKAILLGAVGRTRNSGQSVEVSNGPLGNYEKLWRVVSEGGAPVLMEPANGMLAIRDAAPGRWSLQPLNPFGQPTDDNPAFHDTKDGVLRVPFGNASSPLLLLRHEGN